MISFQKIYGLEHHIVETNEEGEGCHKCVHTDTHSEYIVNLDLDSQYDKADHVKIFVKQTGLP